MKYYLSESDRKVLNQTINTVNNLPVNPKGGKRPTIKNAFAYAELTEQDANGLWSAFEVYFDETGTPNELTDGRVWGLEIPSIIVNGTVSAGTVIRVERYYMVEEEKEQPIWVGSAVGGGATFRLRCKSDTTIGYIDLTESGFDLIDEADNILEEDVPVIQRKFSQCQFFENEILYSTIDSNGAYDLSPFMSGVGVGNA